MRFNFSPEEFIVEEITPNGTLLELGKPLSLGREDDQALERDYFCHFILQKRGWNTTDALAALARAAGVSRRRFDFAGTKDRNSTSVQLASAFTLEPGRLIAAATRVKDIAINGAWKAREKVKLGAVGGNRFEITLNRGNCGVEPDACAICKRAEEFGFVVPNFFGGQRFGSRGNTAEVGRLMLKGDFEAAAMEYLCGTQGERNEAAVRARQELSTGKDFRKAASAFPKHLRFERMMLSHLARNPTDFVGAIRKLPRPLELMFVNAFEAKLFNQALRQRIERGIASPAVGAHYFNASPITGFPSAEFRTIENREEAEAIGALVADGKAFIAASLIGTESKLDELERKILHDEGVAQEDFATPPMPELASRGTLRAQFIPIKGFEAKTIQEGNAVLLKFSLPPGAYATAALEFLLGGQTSEIDAKAGP
ncbi:tRNA pseudouridine(13) synthase TruD [Candidatus Micrarchaeota archaeon]|nr:tRNA pseudouridine(13) synthase TruD [Candidatus Micrarchaeota archaeon]